MTNLNLAVLEGCITKDAELKKIQNGKSYCVFTLVVNRDHKVGEEWAEQASFFNLSLWGTRAEKTFKYLKKGMRIAIQGYLEQSRWDDNGEKKSRIDIRITNLHFLSKISKGDSALPENAPAPQNTANAASKGEAQEAFDESVQNELSSFDFSADSDSYDGEIF